MLQIVHQHEDASFSVHDEDLDFEMILYLMLRSMQLQHIQ